MGQIFSVGSSVLTYYRALWLLIRTSGGYPYDTLRQVCAAPRVPYWDKYEKAAGSVLSTEASKRLFTAVYFHTIGLTFKLWHRPHYRCAHLQQDMLDNLRNVSLPGTGIPLSLFCYKLWTLKAYFWFAHPLVTAAAAWNISRSPAHAKDRSLATIFCDELLAPGHWFYLWRANSVLVAAHYDKHQGNEKVTSQYSYENKWEFLECGIRNKDNPTYAKMKMTPVYEDLKEIVVKHKNIEGGMGVHCFKNALHGGDWIIQERLGNAEEIQQLLPVDAPLSTYRVITMVDPTEESTDKRYKVGTVVFRAGRSGKATDHSAVMLPVDPDTLQLLPGHLHTNWYQVGLPGAATLTTRQVTHHPNTDFPLVGRKLRSAQDAMDVCLEAHYRMIPSVPVAGWDVAVTPNHGAVLLEANLSCNYFGGVYNQERFAKICDTYFANDCADPDRMGASPSPRCRAESTSDGVSTLVSTY